MLRDTFKCKLRIKQTSPSGRGRRAGEGASKNKFRGQKLVRSRSDVEAGSIEIYQINSKYTIPVILAWRISFQVGFNFIHLFVQFFLFSFELFHVDRSGFACTSN